MTGIFEKYLGRKKALKIRILFPGLDIHAMRCYAYIR
jgi:hypothetical protein